MSSSSEDFIDDIVSSDERRPAPVQAPQQERVRTRASISADLTSNSTLLVQQNASDFAQQITSNSATPSLGGLRTLPETFQLPSLESMLRGNYDSIGEDFSASSSSILPSILEEPIEQQLFTRAQVQQILLNHGIRPSQSPTFPMPHRSGPFSSPCSESSSSASSTSFVEPISIRPPLLSRIPEAEFPKTTTAQSKQQEEIKFSNNSSHNKKNLKTFNLLLVECKLMTMADESRPPLVITRSNPYGYCPPTVTCNISGRHILVSQDDIFLRDHDNQRLFSMLNLTI